jgi:sugar phosphate isomerase/epimerase
MKISISSYSFAQYIRAGKMSQLDCIAKAKELGFEAIEFTAVEGENYEAQLENAKHLKTEADRLGMPISSYTVGANLYRETEEECRAAVEELKRQVDIAKILGAPVMRHDVCYALGKIGNSRAFGLMLPTIAKCAREVTEYAAGLGIKTCTENHGYIAQDSYRVESLFCAVAHDNYGMLVDFGNFLCVDENPAEAVSRVAPYAIHCHVKDMLIRDVESPFCNHMTRGGKYFAGVAVGEGDVPVKRCLSIMKRAGYDGYISLEYEGAADCIDGIKKSLENIKKYLSEV